MKWARSILLGAIVVGAVIRFGWLGQQSLDEDETMTVWLMHHSLDGMLDTIPRTESTPPLFYVLEWGWTHVLGTGAVALRSLSATLGVATIAAFFFTGRELSGSRRAGEIAAVLAALSPALVWYSQEGRSYALFVLTTVASVLFLARRDVVLWAVVAALALSSHYFAAFVIVPEALYLLVRPGGRSRRRVVAAVGFVGLVGLALLPIALRQQSSGGSSWIGEIPLGDRLKDVPLQMLLGEGRPFQHWFFGITAAVALLPVAVLLARRRADRRAGVLLLLGLAACGVAAPTIVDAAGPAILLDRNTLAAGALILLACAIAMGTTGRLGVVAAVTACALFAWDLGMVVTTPRMQRENWRDAAHALGQAAVARAIVFGPNASNPLPAPRLVPFQAVYLPSMLTMPDRGATVSEIDALDVRDDLSDTSPPPDPVSPGRGYRLAAKIVTPTFALFRWRSARPRHVTPDQIIGDDLLADRDEGDTLVGLQLP